MFVFFVLFNDILRNLPKEPLASLSLSRYNECFMAGSSRFVAISLHSKVGLCSDLSPLTMQAHQSRRSRQRPPRALHVSRHSNSSFRSQPRHSEFQIISPLSDLSNPSFSAFHKDHSIPTPKDEDKNKRTFVLENLPHPDRISKNPTHVLPNNVAVADDRKKKSKNKKLKNKLVSYFTGGANQLRMQTTKAMKQTSTAVKHGATAVVKKVHHKKDIPEKETQTIGVAPQRMEEQRSEILKEDKFNGTIDLLTGTKDSYFESLWREPRYGVMNASIASCGTTKTPTMALDKAFENALGLHHADDYFERLAKANQSPSIDQHESLASVNYEDATCVSYLISEPTQEASTLSLSNSTCLAEPNDPEVNAPRVSTETLPDDKHQADSEPALDEQSRIEDCSAARSEDSSVKPQDVTYDSTLFRFSSDTSDKQLKEQQRTSHASSNLMYSPETAEEESYTSGKIISANNAQTMSSLQSGQVESRPSVGTGSDDASPFHLMGELVSLGSDNYSANQSDSPRSQESASTLTSQGSPEASVPFSADGTSVIDEKSATKITETRHFRKSSVASYSSLPTQQDMPAIPFTEEGISAIAEESMVNLPDSHNQESSELLESDGTSDVSQTDSEEEQVEGVSLQQNESEPPEGEESISSGPSESQPDESEVLVAIRRFPKSGEESTSSEPCDSQQDESKVDVAIRRLHDTDKASPSSESSQYDELHDTFSSVLDETQRTQETAEIEEKQETVEESASQITQVKEQAEEVVKTAVATGRVFGPRSPGGMLHSIDMGAITTMNDVITAEPMSLDEQPQTIVLSAKAMGGVETDSHVPTRLYEQPKTTDLRRHDRLMSTKGGCVSPSLYCRKVAMLNDDQAEKQLSRPVINHLASMSPSEDSVKSSIVEYRKIATLNDDQREEQLSRPAINHLASMSTSEDSAASSKVDSPLPLLSDQALSNAAFLFSPSYAGGKTRLLTRANPQREIHLSTFAICTAQSRSRLSTFSARSRPAFSIPISSASLNMSSIRSSQSSYSYEGHTKGGSRKPHENTLLSRQENQPSNEGSERHVHFSNADECFVIREANVSRVAMGTPITVVSPPSIDRKISDLTEATVPYPTNDTSKQKVSLDDNNHRQRIASILQGIEEDEATVEDSALTTKDKVGEEKTIGPNPVIQWTYREENGVLGAATPLRSNSRQTQDGHLAPTNSPLLRFREAKNKFSKPIVSVATRTSPTMKQSEPDSGAVHCRVMELNGRLRSNRQPVRKNVRRQTGGENVLAPRQATLEAPLFRNPIIMSYRDDGSVAQSNRKYSMGSQPHSLAESSTVVSGDLKSDAGVSTVVSGDSKSDTGVSTVVSPDVKSLTRVSSFVSVEDVEPEEDEDIFATMMGSPPSPPPEEREYPYEMASDTEDDDDAFADMRRQSDVKDRDVGQKLRLSSAVSLESLLSRDEHSRKSKQQTEYLPPRLSRGPLGTSLRSLVSEDLSGLTLESQKENSFAPSLGPKCMSFTDRAKVNPREQRQHAPPSALCLSPTQRTPIQARKWRSLAAAAQEKDRAQKASFKKQQQPLRGLLKERSSNVMIGN